MNELLRYLNIYVHNFVGCNLDFMYDGQRVRVQGDELGPYVAESIITNKKFGFIKWLVDNDKINFNFVERIGSGDFRYDIEYYNRCTCEDLEEYDEVDRVLMLLAIQDEPIEFLISILK